jgi:hypothetical protein
MTESDHEIRVTLRDVYEVQQKQTETMSAMSAKLDLYIGVNDTKSKQVADHEARLRTVERWVFAIPGFSILIAIAGLVVAILKA